MSEDSAAQPGSQEVADPGAATSPSAVSPPPRIRYDVGGSAPGALSGGSPTRLAEVIQRSPHIKIRSPITVSVHQGTTILTGRVATERDKRVAEMLARLEPGVGRLQNDLTVESAASSPHLSVPGR